MKGLELPINMIVVIAIAVLVLVVVAAFFAGRFIDVEGEIELEAGFNQGCQTLRQIYNCADTSFDVNGFRFPGETSDASFDEVCQAKGYSQQQCLIACQCQS